MDSLGLILLRQEYKERNMKKLNRVYYCVTISGINIASQFAGKNFWFDSLNDQFL
jgi:hypothetical protein